MLPPHGAWVTEARLNVDGRTVDRDDGRVLSRIVVS